MELGGRKASICEAVDGGREIDTQAPERRIELDRYRAERIRIVAASRKSQASRGQGERRRAHEFTYQLTLDVGHPILP